MRIYDASKLAVNKRAQIRPWRVCSKTCLYWLGVMLSLYQSCDFILIKKTTPNLIRIFDECNVLVRCIGIVFFCVHIT